MSKILLELASKHTSHLSLNTQTLQQFPQASNPLLSCVPGHALSSLPIQQSFSVEQLNKGLHDSDSTSISKKLSIFQFPNSHYMSYRTYLQIKDLFIVLLHVLPIFFFQILTEKSNITYLFVSHHLLPALLKHATKVWSFLCSSSCSKNSVTRLQ